MAKNEEARKRLAAAVKKAQPPTREEQIRERLDFLQKERGKSRQQIAERDWLLELQNKDRLKAAMDAGSREIAGLREKLNDAKSTLAALEGQRPSLQKVPAGELIKAVSAEHENYAQCAAIAEAVHELKRRIMEAQAAQRIRTKEFNAAVSRTMMLKNKAGFSG